MKNKITKFFILAFVLSFLVTIPLWIYVDHTKNHNGSIDTQPDTMEFIQQHGVGSYLVFSFWTAGSEGNIIPGSDDYSSRSDTFASMVGIFMGMIWFIMVLYTYDTYFVKKMYPNMLLVALMLASMFWFWNTTVTIWPLISRFIG